MRIHARAVVPPLCLGLLLLAGWAFTSSSGTVSAALLPGPHAVASQLVDGLFIHADLWGFVGYTLLESLAGCLVGALIGIPAAVVVYRSKIVSAAVLPFLGATQAIPAIAIAPLLALWMASSGFWRIVALCALMVFFPILVSSVVGLRHVDKDVLCASLVDGAGSWARLINIELPLALPNILAGVRNGFTLSVTGAVVGEMVMGGKGLGSLLMVQHYAMDTSGMFATIIVLATFAAILYSLVAFAERRWASSSTMSPTTQRRAP